MSESSSPAVVIHYCRACGFDVPAERIAEAVRRELGLTVECRAGWWGCFRIEAAGREIFNRWKSRGWLGRIGFGHTPEPNDVIEMLRRIGDAKTAE